MINILKSSSRKTWNQQGITLLELLVTLAIIAILATIAYPSYLNQVRKSKRTIAKECLAGCGQSRGTVLFQQQEPILRN